MVKVMVYKRGALCHVSRVMQVPRWLCLLYAVSRTQEFSRATKPIHDGVYAIRLLCNAQSSRPRSGMLWCRLTDIGFQASQTQGFQAPTTASSQRHCNAPNHRLNSRVNETQWRVCTAQDDEWALQLHTTAALGRPFSEAKRPCVVSPTSHHHHSRQTSSSRLPTADLSD